jgi:hypothetical protein
MARRYRYEVFIWAGDRWVSAGFKTNHLDVARTKRDSLTELWQVKHRIRDWGSDQMWVD